ncbi:MAG: hypothetical protein II707_10100, partial [Spirochaetales bacterium]|nr:hypothetical protein [Spirochaetales bacterium]
GGVTNFWRNSKYYSDLNNLPTSNSDGSNNWDCIGQFVRQYNPNSNNSYYNIHTDENFEQDDSTITTNDFNAAYYPAYQYVFSRTSDDSNNPWYMPASGEMTTLYEESMRNTINTALGKIGGKQIPSWGHWSSSLSDWIEDEDRLTVYLSDRNGNGIMKRIGCRLVYDTPLYEIHYINPNDPSDDSNSLWNVTTDIDNIAVPIKRYVRAIRKFNYQSSTGDILNWYEYQ